MKFSAYKVLDNKRVRQNRGKFTTADLHRVSARKKETKNVKKRKLE